MKNIPTKRIEPIEKTPGDEGEAQGSQATMQLNVLPAE